MRQGFNANRERVAARGFSLLELLVVSVILCLLFSILIPALSSARNRAQSLNCASNLHSFGDALTLYKTAWNKYPVLEPKGPMKKAVPRSSGLSNIGGEVAEALVQQSLGTPNVFYCTVSLQNDPCATPPVQMISSDDGGTDYVENWKTGQISYLYLAGVVSTYPDSNNQPTFNPDLESPDSPRVSRAVLAGDRTGELVPGITKIVGSNHGKEGGWFYFTEGDAEWREWATLTAHPTKKFIWYWPRVGLSSPVAAR